jgi:hypothetical protein
MFSMIPGLSKTARAFAAIGVLLLPLVAVPTASAAVAGSTMTVSVTASPNPVASGGSLSYTITLSDPQVPKRVCEVIESTPPRISCTMQPQPGPISGIIVTDTLPSSVVYNGVSASNGFSCALSGNVLTCSQGSLQAYGNATITVSATAPNLTPGGSNTTLTNSVAVTPGNESSSIQTTVNAPPPPPMADLVVTSFTGSASVPRGGLASYTVTVANVGAATANGVNVKMDGGTSDFNIVSSSGSPGFGTAPQCYNAPERFSLAAFCPGIGWGPSLAPGGTLTATIDVQVPSAYSGTWNISAVVNQYHNVAESNYNNNTAPPVTTTVY